MLGNKYQQMIQNARSQLASKQGHQHAQGNPSCGCGVPQARLPSSQNPDSGGGWQWQAGPSPLGPGAQATQYSSGPSPISPVPVATFMPPGDIQMVQAGASVAAQACCVSALAPPYTCTIQHCEPVLYVHCTSKTIYFNNPFDGTTFTLDKSNSDECVFVESTSGCCPGTGAPIVAFRNPTNPNAYIFAVNNNGTLQEIIGGDWSFIDIDTPIAALGTFKYVRVDNSGASPKILIDKNCDPDLFNLDVTTQFCGGSLQPPTG